MREIKSGDTIIRIRASNMARTFFYQEFGTDLDVELEPIVQARTNSAKKMLMEMSQDEIQTILSVNGLENMDLENAAKLVQEKGILENKQLSAKLVAIAMDEPKLPTMNAMRLVWAMNAAQNFADGKSTPNFDVWVAKYDEFNFNFCMSDIIAECDKGFFR